MRYFISYKHAGVRFGISVDRCKISNSAHTSSHWILNIKKVVLDKGFIMDRSLMCSKVL